jgi:DNA polymerase-4
MEKLPILLVDMNSFYASVHQALDPSLRGKQVIVAGSPETRHGIVLAASYEAKARGVKTGMVKGEARALCPDGIFIMPQHDLYFDFSVRILQIMKEFTPLVEPFSVDEAFMDVRGCKKLFGSSVDIAGKLKLRIKNEIGALCSVGVGPNKLLAKMAAGLQKPDGLTVLPRQDVPARLWPLPVIELFGVGPRLKKRLNILAIRTIGDLARADIKLLRSRFGVIGEVLYASAHGIDYSPVDPHSLDKAKSVGHQLTLHRDYRGHGQIKVVLLELAELVGRRVRQGGYMGRTVSIVLKDTDFYSLGRSVTLPQYTDLTDDIYRAAVQLLHRHWPAGKPVRLVGLSVGSLVDKKVEQADLFGQTERLEQLARACDSIKDRFGETSLFRAASLTKEGILNVGKQQTLGRPQTHLS